MFCDVGRGGGRCLLAFASFLLWRVAMLRNCCTVLGGWVGSDCIWICGACRRSDVDMEAKHFTSKSTIVERDGETHLDHEERDRRILFKIRLES